MDERLSLLDDLRSGRFEVSIATTYSIDFQFYETVVLRRFVAAGCQRHVLLVDAVRCAEALADPDRRPRLAGIVYSLVPVWNAGAFHPKLVVLVGKKRAKVLVGSHNVTFPGFGGNAELTTRIATRTGDSRSDNLTRDALQAVQHWAEPSASEVAHQALDAAVRLIPRGPTNSRGGDLALLWSGIGRQSLWEQLRPLIPGNIDRIIVGGPFFDRSLEFLDRIGSDLRPKDLIVAIDPSAVSLDVSQANASSARFVDVRYILGSAGFPDSAPLHAKFLLIEAAGSTILITGSANPSAAAWVAPGRNAEAVTLRTNPPEQELASLGLSTLGDAPTITEAQWVAIGERTAVDPAESLPYAKALTAIERDGHILVRGVCSEPDRAILHCGPIGVRHEGRLDMKDGLLRVYADIDVRTCDLVELPGRKSSFAVVDHPAILDPGGSASSVQGDLRAAMGGVLLDPYQLEEVMRIVEKAILVDDVGQLVRAPVATEAGEGGPRDPLQRLGPRVITLEEARAGRGCMRRITVADGNIAVVIDALIRRIVEGMGGPESAPVPEVEERELDPVEEALREPPLKVDASALVRACRRKVTKLVNRIEDRLDRLWKGKDNGGVLPAIVQLAAALGVLTWLRRIEPHLTWVPLGESLVPKEVRRQLFWTASSCLAPGPKSLALRARREVDDEVEEIAFVLGLLPWLGWEAAIDVRLLRQHPDGQERDEFHWAGRLLAVLQLTLDDRHATEILRKAVADEKRFRRDGLAWLRFHISLCEAMVLAQVDPKAAPTLQRDLRRGDLVSQEMPDGRASIAFVVDLGGTTVRVTDPEYEEGRPVLRQFVRPLDVRALS